MKPILAGIGSILLICGMLQAQIAKVAPVVPEARHRVVVDLTTVLSDGWAQTLGNVEGLKQSFQEGVEIEVVVHGPAVSMLHGSDSDFAVRIRKLHEAGVHFVVGTSTLEMSNAKKEEMFPFVEFVPSAAAEIVRKQEAGWSYLKGGY